MAIHLKSGDGPTNARIMLVGESWSDSDERMGQPFQGASGEELSRMLHDAGIMRSECYLTNLVNARAPGGDLGAWVAWKKKDIQPDYVQVRGVWVKPVIREGLQRLLREIALVQPNIIVGLGGHVLWALTGATGVMKWRGSQLRTAILPEHWPADVTRPAAPLKFIPTLHPSMVNRDFSQRQIVVQDLKRVAAEAGSKDYTNEPHWNFIIRPTIDQTLGVLQNLLDWVTSGQVEWVDFDLETRAGHIACAGLSWSKTDAICIPFMCVESRDGYWLAEEEAEIVFLIYLLLTHPKVKVRGQNLLYDAQYTYRHWHFVPRVAQDTMIAQHSAFCTLPKSLAFIASMYCDHYVYWKDDGKTWTKDTTEDQLWRYNCVDCVRTRESGEALLGVVEKMHLGSVDEFQQKFFWPVLQCMQRGVAIDKKLRQKLADELLEEMAAREEYFAYVLGHPLNPRSKTQMAKLFYEDLKQQPIWSRAKKGSPSHITCDGEALAKIALREPILRPLIRAIEEYRSLGVFLSTFVLAPLDVDGRMRTSYNITGTSTYRFASSENAFGSGCVPGDSEVLTLDGWVRIDEVLPRQSIIQWHPETRQLTFAEALPFKTNFEGEMLELVGEQVRQSLTPGHKFPLLGKYADNFSVAHAAQAAEFNNQTTPLGGMYDEGFFQVTAPRLLVAALADGSFEGQRVRISVKKTRKKERLFQLLSSYGIDFDEQSAKEGYIRIVFHRPKDWPEEKCWGSWIFTLAPTEMDEMLDEIPHWDGGASYERPQFFTADRKQAEWVATLAHLRGRSATITGGDGPQHESAYGTWKVYTVNLKHRAHARISKKHWSQRAYSGEVYCVTVPTGFFLIRYKGFIAVTGNTNLQNIPKGGEDADSDLKLPNVRKMFVPDPGYEMFDKDLSKADLRIVVWESGETEMKAMLREGKDPYIEVARDFYKDPTIKKLREDGSEDPRYRTFKSFCHGTHYLGSPSGLAQRLGLTVHQAEKTQNWYLGRFPKIREWQADFKKQVASRRWVENIFGYRCHFFGRIDDATFREAIAWVPQSTVALYINRIWMNIYEQYPHIWVLLQVHDSLVGQFPIHRRDECLTQLEAASQIVLPYADPLIIPTGIKTSTVSWGDC